MPCSSLATKALDSVPDRLWRICPKQNFMNKNWNIKICFKNSFLMIQSAFCAENIVPRPGCDFQKYLPLAPFRFTPAPKSQNTSQWDTSPKHMSHNVTVSCSVTGFVHTIRAHSNHIHTCLPRGLQFASGPVHCLKENAMQTHLAYTGLAKQFEASIDSLCEVWPAWLHESREVPQTGKADQAIRKRNGRDAWLPHCQKGLFNARKKALANHLKKPKQYQHQIWVWKHAFLGQQSLRFSLGSGAASEAALILTWGTLCGLKLHMLHCIGLESMSQWVNTEWCRTSALNRS